MASASLDSFTAHRASNNEMTAATDPNLQPDPPQPDGDDPNQIAGAAQSDKIDDSANGKDRADSTHQITPVPTIPQPEVEEDEALASDSLINSTPTPAPHVPPTAPRGKLGGIQTGFRKNQAKMCTILAGLCLLFNIVALLTWCLNLRHGFMNLEGIPVGGRLNAISQPAAKTVDFFSSTIVAPIIITLFDYVWFGILKVTTINELRSAGSVSLKVLADVSSTDGGSFDGIKAANFALSKRRRLWVFGFSMLLSASAKSLLSNIIAYQSYDGPGDTIQQELHYLTSNVPDYANVYASGPRNMADTYNFTASQTADFMPQFISTIIGLTYQNASRSLQNRTYVGINATKASLNAIPPSIKRLPKVPGYRLMSSCHPSPPNASTFSFTYQPEYPAYSSILFESSSLVLFESFFIGSYEQLFDIGGSVYPFVAYSKGDQNTHQQYLGFLGNLLFRNFTAAPYGDFTIAQVDNIQNSFQTSGQNDTLRMFVWGLECNISRQRGSHTLYRQANLDWSIYSSTWDDGAFEHPAPRIAGWALDSSIQAPGAMIPGYGGAFAAMTNLSGSTGWDIYEANALYAFGEGERMTLEVGMQHPPPNTLFMVQGLSTKTVYQVTYVPLLLLLGLLAALLVSLSAILLMFLSRSLESFRSWREINVVRLIFDSTDILKDDEIAAARLADSGRLSEWSSALKVKYVNDIKTGAIQLERKPFTKTAGIKNL